MDFCQEFEFSDFIIKIAASGQNIRLFHYGLFSQFQLEGFLNCFQVYAHQTLQEYIILLSSKYYSKSNERDLVHQLTKVQYMVILGCLISTLSMRSI